MRSLLPIAGALGLAYGALCAWVFFTQRGQIYFPTRVSEAPGAQALWLESQGEQIKVWVVSRPGARALLYFGGNAEDVAGTVELLAEALPDRSLYLVNYRGYAGSSGRPSETALFADALAVYDRVEAEHPDIAIMGRSLGSGVAAFVASERSVDRLILVTAFDSLVNVARAHFGWLPTGWLLRDRYDSASRAREVEAPVLIVIAGADEMIPRERSEALAAAFSPGQVRVVVVPGVGHNTLDLSPRYLQSVARFLSGSRAATSPRPSEGSR